MLHRSNIMEKAAEGSFQPNAVSRTRKPKNICIIHYITMLTKYTVFRYLVQECIEKLALVANNSLRGSWIKMAMY